MMRKGDDGERILMLTLKQADVRLEYMQSKSRFALPYSWPNINWIVASTAHISGFGSGP